MCYGLLLPYGLLELTIVFVAAGAGLRLGWCWIAPGLRTRAQALATEGRAAGAMALGLAVWLLISGLVEGFVTPSALPPEARLAIGATVWLMFHLRVHARPPRRSGGRDWGRGGGTRRSRADRGGVSRPGPGSLGAA